MSDKKAVEPSKKESKEVKKEPEASKKTVSFIKLKSDPEPASKVAKTKEKANEAKESQPQQQIYIIQTTDGSVPMDGTEVVVTDDNMAVYETVSALEQLSRGQVITTTTGDGNELMVYEEVVLPDESSGIVDQFVDVQEVEVGDGRSASPVKIDTVKARQSSTSDKDDSSYFIPLVSGGAGGTHTVTIGDLTELHCSDCGKLFKSKRSLFGHKKEKHSGVTEVHYCPECGKSFGRKSNLKAHRESLHYGKKFPCAYCERVFTNRSSMNQHIKKTHLVSEETTVQQIVIQPE